MSFGTSHSDTFSTNAPSSPTKNFCNSRGSEIAPHFRQIRVVRMDEKKEFRRGWLAIHLTAVLASIKSRLRLRQLLESHAKEAPL